MGIDATPLTLKLVQLAVAKVEVPLAEIVPVDIEAAVTTPDEASEEHEAEVSVVLPDTEREESEVPPVTVRAAREADTLEVRVVVSTRPAVSLPVRVETPGTLIV